MARKIRVKTIFPAGIFLLLLLVESLLSAGACLAYFLYTGKSRIAEIEANTRSYAVPIAEAFGGMAEVCYRTKKFSRLRALFKDHIERSIFDEAFFVLNNGKLIAHSNHAVEKTLKGNIASDELAYNMELLLQQASRKSKDVLFADYNIVSKPAPFGRQYRTLLKNYFYRNVDVTGWLASRAVFGKKKPVGTVCLIISKQKIYTFIIDLVDRTARLLIISLLGSFIVSFIVSLVVLFRYRSIQNRACSQTGLVAVSAGQTPMDEFYDMTPEDDGPVVVEFLDDSLDTKQTAKGSSISSFLCQRMNRGQSTPFHSGRGIKDAIPVREKE